MGGDCGEIPSMIPFPVYFVATRLWWIVHVYSTRFSTSLVNFFLSLQLCNRDLVRHVRCPFNVNSYTLKSEPHSSRFLHFRVKSSKKINSGKGRYRYTKKTLPPPVAMSRLHKVWFFPNPIISRSLPYTSRVDSSNFTRKSSGLVFSTSSTGPHTHTHKRTLGNTRIEAYIRHT